MNEAAWAAFGIAGLAGLFIVLWSLLVLVDLLPESESYERAMQDAQFVAIAFVVTGLLAILVGVYE